MVRAYTESQEVCRGLSPTELLITNSGRDEDLIGFCMRWEVEVGYRQEMSVLRFDGIKSKSL